MDTSSQKNNSTGQPHITRGDLKQLVVEQADPFDGLLTLEALQQPITAALVVWDEALPMDTYQLRWDDRDIGKVKRITDDEGPGSPLHLEIPVHLLANDGRY